MIILTQPIGNMTGAELLNLLGYVDGRVNFVVEHPWHSREHTVWTTTGRGKHNGVTFVHILNDGYIDYVGRLDQEVDCFHYRYLDTPGTDDHAWDGTYTDWRDVAAKERKA